MSSVLNLWRVYCPSTNDYELIESVDKPLLCSDGSLAHTNLIFFVKELGTSSVTQGNTIQFISSAANVAALRLFASNSAGGIDIDAGSGGIAIDTTGAISINAVSSSDITVTNGALDIDSVGALSINSSGGLINIGNDADAFDINIGTGAAARTITIGNTTGNTSLVLNTGTGGFTYVTGGQYAITSSQAASDSIRILSSNAAGGIDIDSGTGGLDIDSTGEINITSTQSAVTAVSIIASNAAGGVTINAGSGGINIDQGIFGLGTTTVNLIPSGVEETITASAGGAINITSFHTKLNTDAGGDAYTLADGAHIGQLKRITLTIDGGGDAVITPANLNGGTIITCADIGDSVLLKWGGSNWVMIESINYADGFTAPILS